MDTRIDGAHNEGVSRAGIVHHRPDDVQLEYTLRFSFDSSNNASEYEVVIVGLQLLKEMNIDTAISRGHSKLIIDLITGACGVKYREKATQLRSRFKHLQFQHVPRAENELANKLSRLATTLHQDLHLRLHVRVVDKPRYTNKEIHNAVVAQLRERPTEMVDDSLPPGATQVESLPD